MSVIGTTTTAGISAAVQRFDANATAIARQGTADGRKTDLAKEVADTIAAKAEFQANAAVARTGSKTVGALVDILA